MSDRSLQHPATRQAWDWLDAQRHAMDADRADRIDTQLRELSSLFWDWDRDLVSREEVGE